ncbi:MAG TPA: copper homeostasis protein CutC [Flavipsychrobacter sp.]|nr:copper homeostasis protein CutC [Flavipsychrobacter sp.]
MTVKNKFILEVCAYNIQSCIIAQNAGAARIELCSGPLEGGTTSSYGTMQQVREKISIQLYPIIRPRGGNFIYDDNEVAIMKKDILFCKVIGCEGISTGAQLANGKIDTELLKRMADWAYPMGVTCHRVFDMVPDPFEALEDIIDCGCERILTSGLKSTAVEGADLLKQLVEKAEGRITIMPGGGVRSSNIRELITRTGATEYHTSAITTKSKKSTSDTDILNIGEIVIADEEELKSILSVAL